MSDYDRWLQSDAAWDRFHGLEEEPDVEDRDDHPYGPDYDYYIDGQLERGEDVE